MTNSQNAPNTDSLMNRVNEILRAAANQHSPFLSKMLTPSNPIAEALGREILTPPTRYNRTFSHTAARVVFINHPNLRDFLREDAVPPDAQVEYTVWEDQILRVTGLLATLELAWDATRKPEYVESAVVWIGKVRSLVEWDEPAYAGTGREYAPMPNPTSREVIRFRP